MGIAMGFRDARSSALIATDRPGAPLPPLPKGEVPVSPCPTADKELKAILGAIVLSGKLLTNKDASLKFYHATSYA